MKSQLEKLSPRQRARLVRQLELDSDNPLLDPDERRLAERLLRAVKTWLKAEAMYVYDERSPDWRVALNRYRQWHRWSCDCGARGSALWEVDVGVSPPSHVAVDVRGFGLCLTAGGEPFCLACWAGVEPHPTVQ